MPRTDPPPATRAVHLLAVRAACSEMLLSAPSPTGFLSALCRRLVEEAGYAFAWAEREGCGAVRARRAEDGAAEEGPPPPGGGPSPGELALAADDAWAAPDLAADHSARTWSAWALSQGFGAALCLPLRQAERPPLGALGVCDPLPGPAGEDERAELAALARTAALCLGRLARDEEAAAREEALRASEATYRTVFENTGSGTVVIDEEMLILFANDKFARMWGYPKEEIEGRLRWAQFVHPADREMMQRYHYGRRQGLADVPTEYECRVQDRGGRTRHIDMKVGMIPGTSHSIASFMDVTDRRLAEEELRRREAIYRGVFENTGTGTLLIDRDMLILFANAKFASLCGYAKEEIERRMRWADFVHPDDREMMQRYHYGRRKGVWGIPTEYECRIVDRAGRPRHIFMKVGMIPGTSESVASFMDITERKLAEDRLRESEAKLSSVVESFAGLIYTAGTDRRLGFMNRALVERTGREALGEPCHRIVHGLETPCPWCTNDAVLRGEHVRREQQSPRDGRWYAEMRSPALDGRGTAVGVETLLIDITERKLAEQRLEESAESLRSENLRLRSAIGERYRFGAIVGKSRAMQEVYELILKAAAGRDPVILAGESGTGKELAARAIHDLSGRARGPFVAVNCGAVSEHLAESEFFGHRKGSFTGAVADKEGYLDAADGGTLFLDEVGEIPLHLQVKLLRAIEGGGYTPVGGREVRRPDLRLVAATNRDLKALVDQGAMREDFLYRIHVIPIRLPPLRERREDIPLLVDHFLLAMGETRPPVTGEVLETLLAYPWPGNVRELENVLKRYAALQRLDFLDLGGRAGTPPAPGDLGGRRLEALVDEAEKTILERALHEHRWHRERTAEALGIHRKTLFTKLRKHGIG